MSNSKNCSENLSKVFRPGISMSQKLIIALSSFTLLSLSSCGPAKEEMDYREKSAAIADSVKAYAEGLTTDTINGITHNFAKTADIKFKVKNVLDASYQIEDLVKSCGGYISLSNMSSQVNYNSSVKFSEDSIAEITNYTTVNTISLRVPNKQLDSVVRLISKLAVFIDLRKLTADDMKFSLYANSLSEKRYHAYEKKVKKKIQKSSGNLKQELKGEEEILAKQTLADNTRLDSYLVSDKINYSTLSLELYQSEQISLQKNRVLPSIETFTPSLGSQVKVAFLSGFEFLKNLILFFIKNWALFLFIAILFVVYKKTKPWLSDIFSTK